MLSSLDSCWHSTALLTFCACHISSYRVCNSGVGSRIGGAIFLEDSRLNCKAVNFNRQGGNPSIQFVGGDPPKTVLQFKKSNGLIEVVPIDEEYNPQGQPRVQQLLVTSQLSDPTCSSLSEPGNPSDLVFASYDGGMWIHDPRHVSSVSTTYDAILLLCLTIFCEIRSCSSTLLTRQSQMAVLAS